MSYLFYDYSNICFLELQQIQEDIMGVGSGMGWRERGQQVHTSMMAAWTLGFWKAMATSGLAIIFEMTSSGVSPIWSATIKITNKEKYRSYHLIVLAIATVCTIKGGLPDML